MRKLVVVIPAYNEAGSIGSVIKELPPRIQGVDEIKVIVVDDGSTDNTIGEAIKAGVDEVVSLGRRMGLSYAFKTGIEKALEMGADIVVNIDADGQYNGGEISDLVKPILSGEADIVLGSRFKGWIEQMSLSKRIGNRVATWVTRMASSFPTTDSQTGFRAFSKEAALKLNVFSDYTYVQEVIIQGSLKGLRMVEVPIQANFKRFRIRKKSWHDNSEKLRHLQATEGVCPDGWSIYFCRTPSRDESSDTLSQNRLGHSICANSHSDFDLSDCRLPAACSWFDG